MSRSIKGLPIETVKTAFKKHNFKTDGLYQDQWNDKLVIVNLVPETESTYRRLGATGRRTTAPCKHGIRKLWHELVSVGAENDLIVKRNRWNETDVAIDFLDGQGSATRRNEANKILGARCGCKEVPILPPIDLLVAPDIDDYNADSVRGKIMFSNEVIIAYRTFSFEMGQGLRGQYNGIWEDATFFAQCLDAGMGTRFTSRSTTNNEPSPMEMLIFEGLSDATGNPLVTATLPTHNPDVEIKESDDDTPEIRCEKHLALGACPKGDTGCGLYSYIRPHDIDGPVGAIVAQMSLAGVIYPYTDGYRSSQARIEALWMVKADGETVTRMDEGFMRMLGQEYRVPATIVDFNQWTNVLQDQLDPTVDSNNISDGFEQSNLFVPDGYQICNTCKGARDLFGAVCGQCAGTGTHIIPEELDIDDYITQMDSYLDVMGDSMDIGTQTDRMGWETPVNADN